MTAIHMPCLKLKAPLLVACALLPRQSEEARGAVNLLVI